MVSRSKKYFIPTKKANLERLGDDEQQQQKKVDQLDAQQLHTEQELKKNIEALAELVKAGENFESSSRKRSEKQATSKIL